MAESPDSQINYGPEVTFGCGTFFPGEGPFNLNDTGGLTSTFTDTTYDGTGVVVVGPIDPGTITSPPQQGPPTESWGGTIGTGTITPGGGGFQEGCTVDGAINQDHFADGCVEGDPTNFECCTFLGGCPDPMANNHVPFAWGCGGTYEDQGNTDCCTYDSNEDPIINIGNWAPENPQGDIVPGWDHGQWGGGGPGSNYGATYYVDINIYNGPTNPAGPLNLDFIADAIKWDLGGLTSPGANFNQHFGTWYVEDGKDDCCNHYNQQLHRSFQGDLMDVDLLTGRVRSSHFTGDSGPGVPFQGDTCFLITAGQCNSDFAGFNIQMDWFNPHTGNQGFFFLEGRYNWLDAVEVTAGGGGGSTGSTVSLRSFIKRVGQGLLPKKQKDISQSTIVSQAVKDKKIDLNDLAVREMVIANHPTGLMDSDIAYTITPSKSKMVPNNTGSSDLFNDKIDENIAYIVDHIEDAGDWDSTKPGGVTLNSLLRSLKPEARSYLLKIKNYDGTSLTVSQIFAMIGSRILDGTLGNVNMELLRKFAEASEATEDFDITRSPSNLVNDIAALAYIERHYISLDPAKSEGVGRWILPNWKVFATDVDKHIEIRIANGTLKKFYIKDDNTLVDRSSIKVQDGDFVEVKVGGVLKRFFCKSEIDHAFAMPEKVRMKAVSLLGGDPARTLSVSADVSSDIEFNYSLSAPRQNFYVLSAVLSSTVTEPINQGSYLLKNTTLTYQLMDTSTVSGLDAVNEYIRYKANFRTYILDDDDRMLDYIESTGKVQVRQMDILTDAPKTTKTTPLLVRQLPWYIIVYPTNRSDYNPLNSKSVLLTYEKGGSSSRSVRTAPATAPELNKSNLNIFAPQVLTGTDYPDAVGNYSTQNRIAKIFADAQVYQTGYRRNSVQLGSAQEVNPPKLKTTFRVIKEIITELNENYILEWNSLGRSLTTFDVISRLKLKEFSKFLTIENYALLFPLIKKGVIEDVTVFEPTAFTSSRLTDKKTQLVQRRSTAKADTFPPIKSMASGYVIAPPTRGGPSFAPTPTPSRVPL